LTRRAGRSSPRGVETGKLVTVAVQQTSQPQDSFVVTVIPATPAPERTVADVIVGSLSIVAVLLAVALVLGGLFAAVRLGWIRRHPAEADHMPPVRPTAND
jgi:hypothetical protein